MATEREKLITIPEAVSVAFVLASIVLMLSAAVARTVWPMIAAVLCAGVGTFVMLRWGRRP